MLFIYTTYNLIMLSLFTLIESTYFIQIYLSKLTENIYTK